MSCTSLDHIYPSTRPGTSCYCGARTWGPPRPKLARLALGTSVTVLATGDRATVLAVVSDCGETAYRLDRVLRGRQLFDREELEAV